MAFSRLLVANRGEIAIRVARAATELGIGSVAVYSEDDASSLHVRKADAAVALEGSGVAAYLDGTQLIGVALDQGCDSIHPGYGFLSENAGFAAACAAAGLVFVGPSTRLLELFGDKVRARIQARAVGVNVLEGSERSVSVEEAEWFLADLSVGSAMVIKAVGGGGGRGMRIVATVEEVSAAYDRCASEARAAFGNDRLYVERFLPKARHIEVQILGDGNRVIDLGERDCSVQRRHQKLVEIAPAPGLDGDLRRALIESARSLAGSVNYDNIGTFEFLVDEARSEFVFLETNARLQVEHTVTEEVTGVDIVAAQIRLAGGATLADLGLVEAPGPRGYAIQARVNMERMAADGSTVPTGGKLTTFEIPSGPGVRTDTFGYVGYTTSTRYDSLLAKVICHSAVGGFDNTVQKTYRALSEFRIDGVETNIGFLQNVLSHPIFAAGGLHTGFVDEESSALAKASVHDALFFDSTHTLAAKTLAGAKVDANDPLAVLTYGQAAGGASITDSRGQTGSQREVVQVSSVPDGTVAVPAPLQGTVVAIDVNEGDAVVVGQQLLVMESMKMEHEIRAVSSGFVRQLGVALGDTVHEQHPLMFIEETAVQTRLDTAKDDVDLDYIRPDLAEIVARQNKTLDVSRPEAVARRRKTNQRTARENVEDLCDSGTFVEYGSLVLAAQRRRRSLEDLIDHTPADGMITGVGSINGAIFGDPDSRCAVMSYDYTVLAGTQGGQNHRKTDRMIDIAEEGMMPMVLFAEGGGGRPGDTDGLGVSTQTTFSRFAQLSGLVPMVGITSGRCFAGNASLLGCCDVIIATANSNIGMGGPAMIEGGGLGIYTPEQIGPMSVQVANGVVDVAVENETEAVAVAKRYLAYFQGRLDTWEFPDQRAMRRIVPENRLRVYDIREVINTIADTSSVLEIRRGFGLGMVTSLIRIEGRPVGVIANNPAHLGGAIDSDAADKGTRFMQLCDAFDVPLLYLCDT
ncbi:MAG: carbamoyl-phosphate synthase large subunit, partial [Gammaproteobacteria bacterium]|nr:carbamoyl-phosphate synthase large subunit [Gammaproteobacteria bacterium]